MVLKNLKRYIHLILVLLVFFSISVKAQDQKIIKEADTVQVSTQFSIFEDSLTIDTVKLNQELASLVSEKVFKPNPTKAAIYSAIFPGLGQIYNRKYWKLPLVYGGFLGCTYAISWNGNQYNGYKKAYIDFIDDDPETISWEDYRPSSFPQKLTDWSTEQKNWFTKALKSQRDFHRRNRDLSYIISVGVYALCIIDAYVDAQLFDFDISPDLSMRVNPVLYERTNVSSRSVGLQCSFAF